MARALFIGDVANPEFAAALAALREEFEVTTGRDPREVVAKLDSNSAVIQDTAPPYELIVLAQSRPGEIASAELDELRRQFPLAAVVSLAGSWCEGETRSAKPLATACRLYWHQAATRLQQDLARRAAGHTPTWSLPATTSEDERVLARATSTRRPQSHVSAPSPRTVALFGHERTSIEYLVDVCRVGGFEPLWIGSGRSVEPARVLVGIWDVTTLNDSAANELAEIRRLLPAERVVALVGFPRWHDIQHAAHLGLGAVVSKPFVLDDLYAVLDDLYAARDDLSVALDDLGDDVERISALPAERSGF